MHASGRMSIWAYFHGMSDCDIDHSIVSENVAETLDDATNWIDNIRAKTMTEFVR